MCRARALKQLDVISLKASLDGMRPGSIPEYATSSRVFRKLPTCARSVLAKGLNGRLDGSDGCVSRVCTAWGQGVTA